MRPKVQPMTRVETRWKWNSETHRFDIPFQEEVVYQRPDQIGVRGGPVCCQCGGKTRTVLDGEAWCAKCRRYQ